MVSNRAKHPKFSGISLHKNDLDIFKQILARYKLQ